MASKYYLERNKKCLQKISELKKDLPFFCNEFFVGIESSTTPLTRLNYASDLKIFFHFLVNEIEDFYKKDVNLLNIEDLEKISATHLEIFLDYLNMYSTNNATRNNSTKTKARKLSSVRALLKYFFRKDKLSKNISEKVSNPKIRDKEIIRLDNLEVNDILNNAEYGDKLTKMQKGFHNHTRQRDLAILTLFLGTGIRISELVGLDIEDIDLPSNAFTVTRKGGNRSILYFSDEVKNTMSEYIDYRKNLNKVSPDEKALFLSLQNKRINVRTVELLVKKYAFIASPLKHITPHKLRSTYGTELYRQTGDIYVVAEVLGHKDINTTKKHYAATSEDIKRSASSKVKLREN